MGPEAGVSVSGCMAASNVGAPARMCDCDCGNDESIARDAADHMFPYQCHCRCCGPGPASTRRCAVHVAPAAIAWTQLQRGPPIPDASDAETL